MRVVLLAILWVSTGLAATTVEARPKPAKPTSLEDRLEAWERHRELEDTSWFQGLPWRCVGPVVQGGRLVDIEVSPDDPYTFYVAYASGGLWLTTNNGVSFEPLFDQQPSMVMGDVAVDPTNPRTVWVGTGENNSSRSSYGGLGVYRSDDGGETWRYLGLGETDRIGRIVIDPRDSDRVWVAALGKLYTKGGQRGIYLTEDGGETWQQVLAGDEWTGFVDLTMDPSDPDVLYAAAWERSRRPWTFVEGGSGSGIHKSTDGGRTWTRLDGDLPRGEHVGRIGLSVCASQPSTVYAYLDNQALLPEELWDLGDGAVTPKRLRAMSKEEFLQQDPEEVEDFLRNYDLDPSLDAASLFERIERDEIALEDLVHALEDANISLFETDIRGAQVWRSDDAGASWTLTHQAPIRKLAYTYGYYFGQIRVSPHDPEQVFIMGVPMLRSHDGGRTWTGIDGRDVHVDHQSMWIDPDDDGRVLAGNDGGLATSYDGGESWLVLNSNPVGQFYTVAVDMAEPYNIYGGLQDNGVYKGSSRSRPAITAPWQRVGGGDGMYVQIDPRDNATVYLGYQFGYYSRIDPGGDRQRVRPRNALTEEALRYNWQTPILLSSHNYDILYFGANKLFRSMDKGETWFQVSPDLTQSKERGDVPFATITTLDESELRFGLLWIGTDDGQVHVSQDGGFSWKDAGGDLPRDRWVSRIETSGHEEEVAYVSLNGYRDDDMTAYVYRTENLGKSWKGIAHGLPAEPVNVVREDPENPDVLYVGTDRGVYVSLDRGSTWQALQAELPNVPVHDLVVHPRDKELVAGTHGRSVWVIDVMPVQQLDEPTREKPVHVFELDEVQAERGWRQQRSQWFYRSEDDPTLAVPFWVKDAEEVTLTLYDDKRRVLRRESFDAIAGMNTYVWDLLLDEEQALTAELDRQRDEARDAAAEDTNADRVGNGAATDGSSVSSAEDVKSTSEGGEAGPRGKEKVPWSEAVRLGRPLYITPGAYTLEVAAGDERSQAPLTVKAPPAREPRQKAPPVKPGRIGP